jgi:hypothetical protein
MAENKNKQEKDFQETEPLAELHKLREERAKKFDYDLAAMFEDLKGFEKKQKIVTVSLPPKRVLKNTGT